MIVAIDGATRHYWLPQVTFGVYSQPEDAGTAHQKTHICVY